MPRSPLPLSYLSQISVVNGVTYYTGQNYPDIAFFAAHWMHGEGSRLVIPSSVAWSAIASHVPGMSELQAVKRSLIVGTDAFAIGAEYQNADPAPKTFSFYEKVGLINPISYSLGTHTLQAEMKFTRTSESTVSGQVIYRLVDDEFDFYRNSGESLWMGIAKWTGGVLSGPGTKYAIGFSGDTALKISGTVSIVRAVETDLAQGGNTTQAANVFQEVSSRSTFIASRPASQGSTTGNGPITEESLPPQAPTDSPVRNSANFISDQNPNDHLVVIRSGGTVWDAWNLQKNKPEGFQNWDEFKKAVAEANPEIRDLNSVLAGQKLMMPSKLTDGSVAYFYASGATANVNAATNEYYIVVPAGTNGSNETLVYRRSIVSYESSANGQELTPRYEVSEVRSNSAGEETYRFSATQVGISGPIISPSLTENLPNNTVRVSTDSDSDGQLDLTKTDQFAIDQNGQRVLELRIVEQAMDDGTALRTTTRPNGVVMIESLNIDQQVTGSVRESPNLDGTRSRLVTTSVNGVEVVLVQTNTAAHPTVFTTVAVQVDGQDAVSADAFASFIDGRYADPVSYLREATQRPAELQGVVAAANPSNATGLNTPNLPQSDKDWWNDPKTATGVSLFTSGVQALLTGKPAALGLWTYNLTSSPFQKSAKFAAWGVAFQGIDTVIAGANFIDAVEQGNLGRVRRDRAINYRRIRLAPREGCTNEKRAQLMKFLKLPKSLQLNGVAETGK